MKIESKIVQKSRLIVELAKAISYWSGINDEYVMAYTMMLNMFTRPDADLPAYENNNEEN